MSDNPYRTIVLDISDCKNSYCYHNVSNVALNVLLRLLKGFAWEAEHYDDSIHPFGCIHEELPEVKRLIKQTEYWQHRLVLNDNIGSIVLFLMIWMQKQSLTYALYVWR